MLWFDEKSISRIYKYLEFLKLWMFILQKKPIKQGILINTKTIVPWSLMLLRSIDLWQVHKGTISIFEFAKIKRTYYNVKCSKDFVTLITIIFFSIFIYNYEFSYTHFLNHIEIYFFVHIMMHVMMYMCSN